MRFHARNLPVVVSIVAAIMYNDWPLGYIFNPIAAQLGLSSDLEAYGQPYNWFFICGDILCSLLLLFALWQLALRIKIKDRLVDVAFIGIGLFSIMTIASAVLPLRCTANIQLCGFNLEQVHGPHDLTAAFALVGLFIGMAATWVLTIGTYPFHRWSELLLIVWACWGLFFALSPLPLIRQLPHIQLIGLIWEQVFLILSGLGVVATIYSLDTLEPVASTK